MPSPPRRGLEFVKDGQAMAFQPMAFKFTRHTPVAVEWEAQSRAGEVQLRVEGRLEYDGRLQLRMTPSSTEPVTLDDIRFTVRSEERL